MAARSKEELELKRSEHSISKPPPGNGLQGFRARWPAQAAQQITMRVNGEWREFEVGRDLEPSTTLSTFLRERLGFTGLKISCDEGACGACTMTP